MPLQLFAQSHETLVNFPVWLWAVLCLCGGFLNNESCLSGTQNDSLHEDKEPGQSAGSGRRGFAITDSSGCFYYTDMGKDSLEE